MTEPSQATRPSPSRRGQVAESLLVARGVIKRFGETIALRGVELVVRQGEILAITGESGSGKSTLLLCMAGILPVDAGEVLYGGQDLATLRDAERTVLRRTDFGFVFQLGHLVTDLSAVVNVALPLMLAGKRRQAAEREAHAWLRRFGVDEVADRRPGDMSVGQAQRVAVARAFVTGPRVIFADEPTGSLDSKNSAVVIDLLVNAAHQQGSAVMLATHSETVASAADSKCVMRDGLIVNHRR
jgi:putative ABC transport system ATP-binding protein